MGASTLSAILLVVLLQAGEPIPDCADVKAPCRDTLLDDAGEATHCIDCLIEEASGPARDITEALRSESG